jgi:hypothetical protein
VAPILDRTSDATEQLGSPLQLPAVYVREDVTLGHASTVHAAEGRTVDTAHAVLGSATDLAGVLVPLTRGRENNTAWVVTRAAARDAETGETNSTEERSARAVLADVLETAEWDRCAVAQQEQADLDARSTATHINQLVDVIARHVSPGRTSAALDRLTAEGLLPAENRAALAADEACGALEQLLRQIELAGHNPDTVLRDVLAGQSLDGARSPAQVLHYRITSALSGELTARVSSAADLIPADAPAEWRPWLHDRAEVADARRHELGAQTAEQPPRWAVDALGPVPEDVVARQEWEHRAGWAAAYRELVGHTDGLDPLGAAPPRALAETAALFRTAHDALQLVDAGAEEAELTDGQLRARSHALTREETWAPRFVADELAATHEQAAKARTDAEIWAARAETTVDPTDAERLRDSAAEAARRADELTGRTESLEAADEARAAWYAHTAVTRDKAMRARSELQARGIDPEDPEDRVTAQAWLQAYRTEQAEAECHRAIHVEDLCDATLATGASRRELDSGEVADFAPADVRDLSTADATECADPAQRRHVPSADATADAVARAQTALTEIAARETLREPGGDDCRQEQLVRWKHQDRTAETELVAQRSDAPALER